MTGGHVIILDEAQNASKANQGEEKKKIVTIVNASQLSEIGGIWSICGVNGDQELALGTMTGVHIAAIGQRTISRCPEHYWCAGSQTQCDLFPPPKSQLQWCLDREAHPPESHPGPDATLV